ncbi:Hypothetical protein CINCED_3A023966 [Cinara cedri]|uniref:EB domain-containing protein n=1 Tax=Cinara cedri TaxID=506608 RepID=A0A5E4N6M2_9HEMI|nr:Hypothetical protein CINCED_3A023966 [Cinara cedri]
MARMTTVQTLAVYYCCTAVAVLQLAPGTAAAVAGDGPQQRALGAVRNKRWSTTFGANSSTKNTTANNAASDCTTDSDCLGTPYTSCDSDPVDKKKKCFCADKKLPVNNECGKKPRALKTSCETDVECLPNAECKMNATSTNLRLKICVCKDGFVEEKEACNYADLLTFNYAALVIAIFASWIWNDRLA